MALPRGQELASCVLQQADEARTYYERGSTPGVVSWPPWWEWELELSSHVLKRMEDRGFNEVELREMLAGSRHYRRDAFEGRWIITTRHAQLAWEVIVEPDYQDERLVVLTAYSLGD